MKPMSSIFTPATGVTPTIDTGIIYEVNPTQNTISVMLSTNIDLGPLPIGSTGSLYDNDFVWLNSYIGNRATVVKANNRYSVVAIEPIAQDGMYTANIPFSDVDTGITQISKDTTKNWFFFNRPLDVLPFDKVISASDGTSVGLFQGGVSFLKSNPLCQLLLFGSKKLARLVSGTFEVLTSIFHLRTNLGTFTSDLTSLNITNTAGSTRLSIKDGEYVVNSSVGQTFFQVKEGSLLLKDTYDGSSLEYSSTGIKLSSQSSSINILKDGTITINETYVIQANTSGVTIASKAPVDVVAPSLTITIPYVNITGVVNITGSLFVNGSPIT